MYYGCILYFRLVQVVDGMLLTEGESTRVQAGLGGGYELSFGHTGCPWMFKRKY